MSRSVDKIIYCKKYLCFREFTVPTSVKLKKMKRNNLILNIARLLSALIMLQTLFFKFTGAEESVYIFSKLGIEPWGRIASGIMELIASILLFVPALVWLGALLGCGIMAGAILSHITILGISVMDDHGYLFFLACIVLVCCLYVSWSKRKEIPILRKIRIKN